MSVENPDGENVQPVIRIESDEEKNANMEDLCDKVDRLNQTIRSCDVLPIDDNPSAQVGREAEEKLIALGQKYGVEKDESIPDYMAYDKMVTEIKEKIRT